MQVALPSGNTVDLRDKLMAGDKFAAQDAVKFASRSSDGSDDPRKVVQQTSGDIGNRMRRGLLAQIITAWSFEGVPVPSANPIVMGDETGEALKELFAGLFDLDDWNALEEATEPLLAKVRYKAPNRTPSST